MESTVERSPVKNVQANYLCCERTPFGLLHVCREQCFPGDVKTGLPSRPPDAGPRHQVPFGGDVFSPDPILSEHSLEVPDVH